MRGLLPRDVDTIAPSNNLKLNIDDLIPDSANDIVFMAADTISRVEIHTPDAVVARGKIDSLTTANGECHSDLDFIRLASGIRLLFPPTLTVVPVLTPPR
ncbi:hypothetical protein SAMN07250955_11939 [Arboricoccus pini]|uniref:Uncharacterized protein n=1 Tax=Arboricoccus pini TaxID=1963835 RepID=A0A212S199_9PROT|nr:hypothetical protein [Arboricoccus pini]SNB78764.1 hypothetical protein SAMN07250955_11939 [Arboricoccus pini]